MTAKKMKAESGGARMKRHGKTPILLGVTDEEKELLRWGAIDEGRPLTQYILHNILMMTKKKKEKSIK